ncbi:lytic murein transglycosylase B [Sulfurovum sp. NBC37-1]|uniref:lytic murein transglycosylase B n=1 Tax=Sulfurovum sp. (strain NBC37-1) TaxID=387093 RepID=UPI00015874AD|nr:lytic murein transglycosylase B [Sulfurovum sp. NBC37-1]BAF71441.1 membrane-bound lytic murein transglycosylase [Sulfurovum sp. NBC37-1]
MKQITFVLFSVLLFSTAGWSKDYTKKREVRVFIDRMVKHYHFNRSYLNNLFSHVKFQRRALAIYVPKYRKKWKPPKRRKKQGPWDRYEEIFLKPSKTDLGIKYMHKYRKTFLRAYKKYGVQPEYIAAIIGIESHFGKNTGKFPVLDTLTTLAFEKNRRQRFYRYELKEFLLMTRREKVNPQNVKGSFAGAIGLGQFMPSNYRTFVVDFNKDGKKRMNSPEDAIGSVAYYFKSHGWRRGQPVAVRVSYPGKRFTGKRTGYKYKYSRASLKNISPKWQFNYHGKVHLIKLKRYGFDELWYGAHNFYVITRYNHSAYYAMAVYQLAEKLKKGYKKKYGSYLR